MTRVPTTLSPAEFTQGGRGTFIPIMEAIIELPEIMVSSKGRIARIINRATRDALRKELLFHHKKRVPEHFNRFRQSKYGFAERSERVKKIKERLHQADLVKSGRTKREMTRRMSISFPRTGQEGTSILGRLRWPTGFRISSAAVSGVTPSVMADEISRWTAREEATASGHIRDTFLVELNKNLSRRAKFKVSRNSAIRLL